MTTDHLQAFTTPILVREFPGSRTLNENLEDYIAELRKKDEKGIIRSNAHNTWHSQLDFLKGDNSACNDLKHMFADTFSEMIRKNYPPKAGWDIRMTLEAWAMHYSGGGYASPHNHPNSFLSSCYYIRCDGEEDRPKPGYSPGCIEFLDPRAGVGHLSPAGLMSGQVAQRVLLKPLPGHLIVFPGWLVHTVHPVKDGNKRISVACNAIIHTKQKEAKDG